MRLPLGQWRPDLAPLLNGKSGLQVARNARPKAGGYRPAFGLANLTNATALSARARGSISGVDNSGSGFLMAGTATTIEENRDAGFVDVSRTPAYQIGSDHRWDFAKYGDLIFALTPNENMQYLETGGLGTCADVENAPRGRHLAVIRNFLMAGNIYDPVQGPIPAGISWSAVDAPLTWPVLGTTAATAIQAGRQELVGGGGWVNDVVAGAEVGAVFRERAIYRLDYVGGRSVFDINRVEESVGMLVPHSGVAFERMVFFISEDGFRVFDYTQSETIGKDRVSSTFLADLDTAYLDRVWVAKDPDETLIWIAYPGAGNTAGQPNRVLWWDYKLDKFSDAAIDVDALIEFITETSASIDAPEVLPGDPDDLGDPGFENPGGTPGYGDTSFDDRGAAAGASRQGAFDTTFIPSDFSGAQLEARFETGDVEHFPGYLSFVNGVRPLVDGAEATVAVGGVDKRSESGDLVIGEQFEQDEDGKVSVEIEARYIRYRMDCPIGWTDALGMDVAAQPGGEL